MRNNNLPIQDRDYRTLAAKAVHGFVNKKFSGFFSEEEVEDLVSEVVMKMWKGRNSFDPSKGKVFTWVWTIAKNVVLDEAVREANRKSVREDKEDEEMEETAFSPSGADDEVLRDECAEMLLESLRQERDKRILLYLMEEMEYEEIARREGMTASAVYMAVYHLRRRLHRSAA